MSSPAQASQYTPLNRNSSTSNQRVSINSQRPVAIARGPPQYEETKTGNKWLAFFLLLACIALSIYFFTITKDFKEYEECKKLYVASEVNEYVWYYTGYIQFFYLVLSIGSEKYTCYNFQESLPNMYKFFNILVLLCVLGATIALQICMNYQEPCGNLDDQIRGYLAIAYIILVILIVYLAFAGRKKEKSGGAVQQPIVETQEHQRLVVSQNQGNYQTFTNQA